MRKRALFSTAAFALLVGAQAQTVPSGWRETRSGTIRIFTPSDLKPGETYELAVLSDGTLGGKSPAEWLTEAIRKDAASGKGEVKMQLNNGRAAVAVVDQGALALVYTASSADGKTIRWVRIKMSSQDDVYQRYTAPTQEVIRQISGTTKTAAPPAAASGKPKLGGPIQEGIYQGEQKYGGKHRTRFKLWLYANGEYRLVDLEGAEDNRDGRYEYDPVKGTLNISSIHWLNTKKDDPDDAVCLFGRGPDGKGLIYANNDRSLARAITTLVYIGPVDRLSPEGEEAAKAAAVAEAKRYKFVTKPGQGLGAAKVAAVVHNLRSVFQGTGAKQINTVTLLLKDGTAYAGFPVSFEMWDVATSRRKEPAKWGRWQKAGAGYQVAFGGGAYRPLVGQPVRPATTGLRLAGRWGTGESEGDMLTGTSYRLWGITFTPDGQFVRDERGGSGSSNFMATGTGTMIHTQYDDEGSYVGAVTPGAVIGREQKRDGKSHRAGTYRIEGYTLVLSYADGRVERRPFFLRGKGAVPDIWFDEKVMEKDEEKAK